MRSEPLIDIFRSVERLASMPKVYPGYIGTRIKAGLRAADTEQIVSDIGPMETIGDCRYAIIVTDFNGTQYRVTVEVAK
jgi:hypothetical protein